MEPFVHQVGGHFPMACLAKQTVCKPLNEREHLFYKTLPKILTPYVPRYEGNYKAKYIGFESCLIVFCLGTMRVEVREDDHGYITLIGQPPPNFGTNRRTSIHHQILQLHHQGDNANRSKSRSSSSGTSKDDTEPDDDDEDKVYCNPWALKCHRDHLKKLGLLTTSSGGHDQDANQPKNLEIPQNYLLLENLVSRYIFPCVLDLKVGERQYSDDVSPTKKARKMAKSASTTSATLGLRLTGMQVYLHSKGKYLCHNKYFGRDLTDDSFINTLQEFFTANEFIRVDVITQVISSLKEMIDVLSKLETYRFYTASLLVTYDGQVGTKEPLFDLRLIDFAHSTHRGLRDPIVHEGPDSGFIQGLKSLIHLLEQLVQKQKEKDP